MTMKSAFCVLTSGGRRRDLRQLSGGWIFLLIALLFLSGPPTYAQTTAQLTGTVQDSSGAMIPSAQVTLTDEASGITRIVQTNRAGLYAFPALVPGTYSVKVTAKS